MQQPASCDAETRGGAGSFSGREEDAAGRQAARGDRVVSVHTGLGKHQASFSSGRLQVGRERFVTVSLGHDAPGRGQSQPSGPSTVSAESDPLDDLSAPRHGASLV